MCPGTAVMCPGTAVMCPGTVCVSSDVSWYCVCQQ